MSLSVHLCVCLYVCQSVCVQNTSVCQSVGRGIKSHLVTALVIFSSPEHFEHSQSLLVHIFHVYTLASTYINKSAPNLIKMCVAIKSEMS